MKPDLLLLGLVGITGTLVSVEAATSGFLVTKGCLFSQTSDSVPTRLASGAFTFRTDGPGFGGPPLTSGCQVRFPSGTTRTLAYDSATDTYAFSAAADSQSALDAIGPVGSYAFTLTSGVMGTLTGTVVLPAASYLPAPKVLGFAGTQAVDPAQDYTLSWGSIAGATEADFIYVQILEAGTEIQSDELPGTETSDVIYAGALESGKTYEVRLQVLRITEDMASFPSTAYGFYAETRLALRTTGGTPVDTTPPTLATSYPANGAVNVGVSSPVMFVFNEAMDTSRVSIQWSGADGAKFSYGWSGEDKVLTCTYSGSLPAGVVNWVLNPQAGAATNLRDKAGNDLPPNTYAGSFTTQGGSGGCPGASPVEASAFGLMKQALYLQSDAGTPVGAPTNAAMVMGYSQIPNAAGRAAVEFPASPAPLPHQLKFFQSLIGVEMYTESFASVAAMDLAYPAGNYDFELRQPESTVVAHVVLVFASGGYPTLPRLSNFTAAQAIDPAADFTLTWDAFAGANTNTDAIQIEVTDRNGQVLFSAPDSCANRPLPATATAIVLPKNTLASGQTYTLTLSFFHLNDSGKTMPGTTAKGFTAVVRQTRTTIKTTGGLPDAPAPIIRSIALVNGKLTLLVDSATDRSLTLEHTTGLGLPFTSLVTTNPPVSPVTIVVAPPALTGFLRASHP